MRFEIGQKVRVKDFGKLAKEFSVKDGGIVIGDYLFDRAMKIYCGEEYRIYNCFADGTYELMTNDNEGWLFHEKVLETIDTEDAYITQISVLLRKIKEQETEINNLKAQIKSMSKLEKRAYNKK